ncbi:MAG: S1C family serine protease [Planctomycetota bacterium]
MEEPSPRVLLLLLTALLLVPLAGARTSARGSDDSESLAALRQRLRAARQGVVRIQWRARGRPGHIVERHAIVVEQAGWLVLAGPPPAPSGTLAATLADGRSMRAKVWGRDARTGLTLLRVPVASLEPLPLRKVEEGPPDTAAPDRLPPGLRVTMLTAEGSVTRGVLRANLRTRWVGTPGTPEAAEVSGLDEAALSVVPTDLGAPWLDDEGRVVGLLVGADVAPPQIPRTEDGDDLHFRPEVVAAYAVPSSVIRTVWPLLRDHREVPRAALGIKTRPLDPVLAGHLCSDCGGRVVVDVAPGGPADRAGVKPKDLVRRVDGRPMAPRATLSDLLLPHRPGERIRLGLLRAGKPLEVPVVLGLGR